MSDDKEKAKILLEHFQKLLNLIQSSHATKEEQNAIWHELISLHGNKVLEDDKIMGKGRDKGKKEKKKPKKQK